MLQTFIEYKCKTNAKARKIKTQQQQTGNGKVSEDLNEVESKLMGLIGWTSCTGDPCLSEVGLNNSEIGIRDFEVTFYIYIILFLHRFSSINYR